MMAVIKDITHANWIDKQSILTLHDGEKLGYMEAGNTEGEPLILLHGFGNSGRNWKSTFEYLEDDYHIFAVDEIGSGQSSCPDAYAFTITRQAQNVLELMDALGIESAYLAGHSIGSYICQAVGFMAPKRVKKLALVSTFARMQEKPSDIAKSAAMYASIEENRPNENWYSERADYPDQEGFRYQLEDLQNLPSGYFAPTWWGMTMTDHRNFLQFIEAPVMVVWGGNDMGLPEVYREEFKAYMSNAEYHIYEGLGHEIVSRAPERLSVDMRNFFEK